MTSSNAVVKTVAKKLKYYFEVKRLEDGFDLSETNSPKLDHPPLKARPTLQYDGLHDRPLKHYFSQPEVRVHLTQMGMVDAHLHNPRERKIKKNLTRTMKKHQYLKSTIPECYYVYTPAGRKIHPSMVGFGASPKSMKKKGLKGGWPVLRSAPPVNISRGEAERLVNSASKLLAATETVEQMSKSHPGPTWGRGRQSAPRPFEQQRPHSPKGKRRPLTAKYTWDINGHKLSTTKVKAYDDSYLDQVPKRSYLARRSRTPSPASSEESQRPIRRPSPPPPPKPPSPAPPAEPKPRHRRPHKHKERTVINLPPQQIRDEVKVVRREPPKYEMGIQTDRQLLEAYDHMEDEVKEGPWAEYQIYVNTGDRIGASTSADVFLTIYGDKGRTPPLKLASSKHNKVKFQRGKEDLFILAAHHVGQMRKIKIGHDRPQLSYAWYCESVMVYDMNDKKIYDFPCERWFSGQDDDHRTYRFLPVDRTRSFVDALEKRGPPSPPSKSEEDSSSDGDSYTVSMEPKRSHRSRSSSSSSSSSTSSSSTGRPISREKAKPKPKPETPRKKTEVADTKNPGTVIQFKKKGSQKVEEEVILNDGGKEKRQGNVEQEYLAGYKAGLEAVEASERKHKEDERTRERQLLTGPSVHDACRKGDLSRVKELLDKFPEMKEFKDESGWLPLHLAAGNGHVDIIKWLTSAGRDDLDVETPTGYTPTHVAAMNGHINAVMVLNAMGADLRGKAGDKQTPLHLSSRAGHLECVKWLVANGADLVARDDFGRTPLDLAEEYKQHTVADFLRVCERDLSDPNSTFAQMHRAHQRGGSVKMPTIREDDKTSSGSVAVRVGSASTGERRRSHTKEKQLKEKRKIYEEQHHRMEDQGLSFLDSVRRETEN